MKFNQKFICKGTAIITDQSGSRIAIFMKPWHVKIPNINNMRGGINKGIFVGKNLSVEKATVFVYVVDKQGGEHFVRKKVFTSKIKANE